MKQYTVISGDDALERIRREGIATIAAVWPMYTDLLQAVDALSLLGNENARVIEIDIGCSEILPNQIERALETRLRQLLEGMEESDAALVKHFLAPQKPVVVAAWLVNSFTSPGQQKYNVRRMSDGEITCDCPAFKYRKEQRPCKHIDRVVMVGDRYADIEQML